MQDSSYCVNNVDNLAVFFEMHFKCAKELHGTI